MTNQANDVGIRKDSKLRVSVADPEGPGADRVQNATHSGVQTLKPLDGGRHQLPQVGLRSLRGVSGYPYRLT